MSLDLTSLGWNGRRDEEFALYAVRGLVPARVSLEHTHIYRVLTADGDTLAKVAGRLRHQASARSDYPAVGDWVAIEPDRHGGEARIHAVLSRTSRFSRRAAGDVTEEQIVAANIDTVFLVSGLDDDFNLRRIERYLAAAHEGGAEPVVVLNKADLRDDVEAVIEEVRGIATDVAIHAVDCRSESGLDPLQPYIARGRTVAFLGSSGVGKSTIINRLVGKDVQRTAAVRSSDSRGRHTTSRRELIVLATGGLLIDTPGMRELQLWDTASGSLAGTFDDIAALAPGCHFRDCTHDTEPRCEVRAAVERGILAPDRLSSYHRLQRERAALARQKDVRAQSEERRKWRTIHKSMRLHYKAENK
jgi:ribosome biogenesis GTPase / thiamine phosphate phosphatase